MGGPGKEEHAGLRRLWKCTTGRGEDREGGQLCQTGTRFFFLPRGDTRGGSTVHGASVHPVESTGHGSPRWRGRDESETGTAAGRETEERRNGGTEEGGGRDERWREDPREGPHGPGIKAAAGEMREDLAENGKPVSEC